MGADLGYVRSLSQKLYNYSTDLGIIEINIDTLYNNMSNSCEETNICNVQKVISEVKENINVIKTTINSLASDIVKAAEDIEKDESTITLQEP